MNLQKEHTSKKKKLKKTDVDANVKPSIEEVVQMEGMSVKKKKKDRKTLEGSDSVPSMALFTEDEEPASQRTPKVKRKHEDMDGIPGSPPESTKKTKKKKRTDNRDSEDEGAASAGNNTHRNRKNCVDADNVPEASPGAMMRKKKKKVTANLGSPVVVKEELEVLETPKTRKKKMLSVQLQETPQTTEKQTRGSSTSPPKFPKAGKGQQEPSTHSTPQKDLPLGVRKYKNDGTPKKKKKSSLEDDTSFNGVSIQKEVTENEDENDNVEEEAKEFWTEEETRALLDRIEEQLPNVDRRRYRTAQKNLDWASLATDRRSAKDCKERLNDLITRHLKCLTLKDMLRNLRKLVDEGRSNKQMRAPSAINLFMKEYLTPKRLAKMKTKEIKVPVMAAVAEAWRNLPEEMQQVFRKQAEEKKQEFTLINKRNTPMKAKLATPYKVWTEGQKEEGVKDEKELTRDAFNKLQDEEKVPYITASLGMYRQYLRSQGKDVESIGVTGEEDGEEEGEEEEEKSSVKQPRKPAGHRLSKSDLLIYLTHKGMPPFPPSKIHNFFLSEMDKLGQFNKNSTMKEKMNQAVEMYRQQSLEEKKKYQETHAQVLKDFKPKLEKWIQKQDPITVLALRLHMGASLPKYLERAADSKQEKRQKTEKKGKKGKKKKIDTENLFPNVAESFMSCPKFHNEPQRPPATPYHIFSLKFKQATEGKFASLKEQNQARREKWKKMDGKKRESYTHQQQQLQQAYRAGLMEFVSVMDKKMRLVYLGFNRMRLYQYFKEDIFQDKFPNSKYPLYGRSKSPSPKRESVLHEGKVLASVDVNSDDDAEDSEEEEEEEEEGDDVEPPINTRSKANRVDRKTAELSPRPTEKSSVTQEYQSEESSGSEDEEEDAPVSPQKKGKPSPKQALGNRYHEREDSSSDEPSNDESEEEADVTPSSQKMVKQNPKKVLATRYPEREESSSDEEQRAVPASGTKAQHHPYPDTTDSDDSDSEEDNYYLSNSIMPVYRAAKGAPVATSSQKTATSDSEDDSD